MRQVSIIALVSVLALFLGGCPAEDEGGETSSSPSPTTVAVRTSPKSSPSATPFANPLTPQKSVNPPTATGLIQSPPAEAVAKQISRGRADPFSAIQVQPEITVSPNPAGGGGTSTSPVPVVPPLPGVPRSRGRQPVVRNQPSEPISSRGNISPRGNILPRPPQQGSRPQTSVPRRPNPAPGSRPAGFPPTVATAPRFIPQLPKLPEPTQAKGVEVTGVVEVGGETRAIIKVPNEPSRTVREGDRLFNGQVLVKRIEARGAIPLVILEQYGVEVARRIGDAPAGGAPGEIPGTEPGAA